MSTTAAASGLTLKQKAMNEFREFMIISIYLFVVLGLLELHKSVILRQEHIDFTYTGIALINALALGKVILIAGHFHFGERYNERPLIYPTLIKSAIFAVILTVFKIVEEYVVGYFRHESFKSISAELGGGSIHGVITFTLLAFAFLTPFVGFNELQRVLGEGKLLRLFFRPRSPQSTHAD
jgi:hypothetical protein